MTSFCRFDLRTTDAEGARAFYARLLGHERARIWPLHEQAIARGARPHWLGHLEVEDAERTAAAFVERGAVRFGPTMALRDGGQAVVLRDPGGAVVAVSSGLPAATPSAEVVFHVLNTTDAARAMANYCELFGWEKADRLVVGEGLAIDRFAWRAGGASVGAIADVTGRPGVHPHWLFFFAVPALEPAMALTREAGGLVLPPTVLPDGTRVCVCDDPQGATFALREGPRARAG